MGVSVRRGPWVRTIDASPLAQTVADAAAESPDALAASTEQIPQIPSSQTPLLEQQMPQQPTPPSPGELPPRGENSPMLGRYVLIRELGEGGMGVVYAAYDEELDRKVALKLLHPSRQGDSQLRTRILREAQALARVSSPNVVQVYQVGEVDGQLFIAMEFISGTTLTRWQAEKGRSWQDILRMYIAAGQGVLAAHQAGLVHRDFKPDNVLIGKDDRPRVVDFGLARIADTTESARSSTTLQLHTIKPDAQRPQPPLSITQAGMVMGTPLYMSPEQHMGKPADSRSDQFSFCVALYEALYQRGPFECETVEKLAISAIMGKVLPRPPGSQVPTPVHEALLRGLSCAPEQRYPSMRELLTALAFDPAVDLSAGPRSRRKVTLSMLALSVTAVLGSRMLGLVGVGAFMGSVLTTLVFFGVFVVLTARFRRELRTNIFHRGTLVYGLVYSGQVLFLRALGQLLGLTYSQLAALDLAAMASTSCMMASLIMPDLGPLVPLHCLGALAAAYFPAHAANIASAILAFTLLIATFRWNRTVGTRRSVSGRDLLLEKRPRRDRQGPAPKPTPP